MHKVRDVYCVLCLVKLGWSYEFAHDKGQMYKEGHVVLEKKLICAIEEPNMSLAASLSPFAHCGVSALFAPSGYESHETMT